MFRMTWKTIEGKNEERNLADKREVDIFFNVLMGCSNVIATSVSFAEINVKKNKFTIN